ncbi:MAG: ABC transporter ATP-binding protein [Deltaproteobacteria bacterium]|nr:MAG: ABC transporter ATP-binding protein [Deltaproteobacteria bacterium]
MTSSSNNTPPTESGDTKKPTSPKPAKESKSSSMDMDLLRRLWPFAKPNRGYLWLALALSPITMALALLQPWLLKTAIDDHISKGQINGLQWIAGLYLASIFFAYLCETTYTISLATIGQNTILRLREAVYKHLISLAPSFFDKRPAGALLTRCTSDVEALGETLTSGVITIVLDILLVTGTLSMMLWLDWQLTLVLLFVAPPLLWLLRFFRKQLRKYFLQIRESLAAVNATLAERIAGVEIVQLFNHHKETQELFEERNRIYRDATVRSNVFDALMYAVVDGTGSICIALMLWYATSGWFKHAITVGLLVAFIDYLQRLFRPLQEFSGKIAIIQRATTALDKIFSLLDDKEAIDPGKEPLEEAKGHIVLKDVSFGYRDIDILRGLNVEIKPGEVVAVVGPTGSGKTTLIRLLTRAYEGYRGSITIDGKELSEVELSSIRSMIATVQQDIQLFSETISFNVGLDNPRLTEESLHEAAQLVHADTFIQNLPLQWQQILRERGANLSTGQGQLLTFARTMAYDPSIVILDEATASIDSQTESLIQDAIARIFERKTVIVIAHRLSTITAADRILVMQQGQVIEQGSHSELLAIDGLYAQLFKEGFAADAPEEPASSASPAPSTT